MTSGGVQFNYDDSQLQRLYAQLSSKERTKALRGAFRQQANLFRETALNNLELQRTARKKSADKVVAPLRAETAKGIRSIVYTKTAGFRVTIGSKRGKKGEGGKPVLVWMEAGTAERRTKNGGGPRHRVARKRRAHPTGRIIPYSFMTKTKDELSAKVTDNLHESIKNYVVKVAKKNGCIV